MNELDQKVVESLSSLGLKDQESKVYLALLKLGQARVGQIADESGVQRTFIYDILDDLQETGLVSEVEIRGRKRFSPVSLEQFKRIQENKLERFEKLIPEMKALISAVGDRPKVQFFEGLEGIRSAQNDTLSLPPGSEFLSFSTGEGLYEEYPEYAIEYVRSRVKKKITVRAIAPDDPSTQRFAKDDEKHLRRTRLIPRDKFVFGNEINIYGDKVMIMSLKGELIAVVIESEVTSQTMRSIFELAWLGAEKTTKA